MKKSCLMPVVLLMVLVMSVPAMALTEKPSDTSFVGDKEAGADELVILGSKDILALADQKLVDVYIDVVVEIQATNVFHATSGFTPKQYKQYKALLKYRLQLLLEIHRRKLELPAEVK